MCRKVEKMEFRPCIDIHNGKVKQIVGGSLKDAGNVAQENFVSEQDAAFYANMYKEDGIRGGHIILLNAKDSGYYEATKEQALAALARPLLLKKWQLKRALLPTSVPAVKIPLITMPERSASSSTIPGAPHGA